MDMIEEQVLVYNARDLDRFIATYSQDVVIEDGENNVLMRGHKPMRERYGALFEANPRLHGRILNRLRIGKYTIEDSQMFDIKPIVTEEVLLGVLKQQFGKPVDNLKTIEGGLIAQTFTFSVDGQEYIVRFDTNKMGANYAKEAYIVEHFKFNSALVPIPAIIGVGQVPNLWYCISDKVIGQRLDRLSLEEFRQAMPSVLATLDAIHAVDVSGQSGYGVFDDQGQGFFSSWPVYLMFVREEERPDGFFGKWHQLFETSFLERDVFERICTQMDRLLDSCPEERYVVHGGYGFGNLLVANGRVTAVLDWIDAKYGDFLYDVAWLDFFDPKRGYPEIFRANYVARDIAIPSYEKRLLCYQCYMALDGLRFFAKSNDPKGYQWVKERILNLITF